MSPGGKVVKNLPANCRRAKRHRLDPWIRKIPWKRAHTHTHTPPLKELEKACAQQRPRTLTVTHTQTHKHTPLCCT